MTEEYDTLSPFFCGAMIGGWELFLITLFLAGVAFWVWMLIDCANSEAAGTSKICWMLFLLLAGFIAAPAYFVIRKGSNGAKRQDSTPPPALPKINSSRQPLTRDKSGQPSDRAELIDVFDDGEFYRLEKLGSSPAFDRGWKFFRDGQRRVFVAAAKEHLQEASSEEKYSPTELEVKLATLKSLYERRLITAEDYSKKKLEVLSRL